MSSFVRKSVSVAALALLLVSCGKESNPAPAPRAAAQRDEWKYQCQATLLSGYQWVYVGTASRREAEGGTYFCYGYSPLSNFCTEVRYGGVLGAVTACNFGHVGRVAYTWNRW